ncbi:MAG: relaxase/mobilization nuclease domain-containing protein [Candidatus Thiodiazotropha sp. (ex Lucinoma aequizonata)]|nr:relaxase/mobilization nuclease domain-containing protein [Candidatus Thiodiazotropha sp. (ex Lucinoma aequizonata)]MCU7889901.1 relaxase/mobilization nuclease domain-containing protein [Candidatus Thiodiazotropha sp. (ex Lucinoma aequizonata)]MCU7909051.1 relaxase/mobilization nuclease domain-containing protein [Candidatus Thiodiazotropha sp. (ex Lucinoma aequizonata)]
MIIKSMSRKEPSFGQLVGYMSDIDKSDEQYNVYQNLYSRKQDDIEQEFLRNAAYVAKRKNGNYLYHEILSITKAQKLDDKQQKEILRDIAYEYAKRRASQNLVFGTLHDDHDSHLHYHLLISANASGESKKTRLAKAEFDKIKKELESRVLEHHPELEQDVVINKEAGEKLSNKGAEQKRRTGKTPERDQLKTKLQNLFSQCDTKEDFFAALNQAGLEFYVRGKNMGVKDLATERNHRLKTLGLLENFQALSERIELDEAATAEQARAGSYKKNDNKPEPKPDSAPKQKAEPEPEIDSTQEETVGKQNKHRAEIDKIRQQQSEISQNKKGDKQ